MEQMKNEQILSTAYKTAIAFVNSFGYKIAFDNMAEKIQTTLNGGMTTFNNIYDEMDNNVGYVGSLLEKRIHLELRLNGYDIKGNIYFHQPEAVDFALVKEGKVKYHSHFALKKRFNADEAIQYYAQVRLHPNDTLNDSNVHIDLADGTNLFYYSVRNNRFLEDVGIQVHHKGDKIIKQITYQYQNFTDDIAFHFAVLNEDEKAEFLTKNKKIMFRQSREEMTSQVKKWARGFDNPTMELTQMMALMLQMNSNFAQIITNIDAFYKTLDWYDALFSWFVKLFSLTYPEFSDEEIKALFGVTRERIIFQDGSPDLTAFLQEKSELVRKKVK